MTDPVIAATIRACRARRGFREMTAFSAGRPDLAKIDRETNDLVSIVVAQRTILPCFERRHPLSGRLAAAAILSM
jgi:hypothetical protein